MDLLLRRVVAISLTPCDSIPPLHHHYTLSLCHDFVQGDRCKIKDCPFRHISEENRLECVFYSQGFCIHGPFCRYKHLHKDRIDLPLVADFTLGLSQMQAAGKDGAAQRRPAPKPNEFYKISMCKHFMAGECPFGEGCHFAHGEDELRKFPRQEQVKPAENLELGDNMFANQDSTTVDYFQGGSAGGGKLSPIVEPEQAHFFILLAQKQRDLAISAARGEWYVKKRHAEQLNHAYQGGSKQVMLFFTTSSSKHIQGAALMTSEATYQEVADHKNNPDGFCFKLQVEWYRTTELPTHTAKKAAPELVLPSKDSSQCQTMSPQTGESLMKAVWNSPLVTLYESWKADKEPPALDAFVTDFRAPAEDEIAWPTMPGPGMLLLLLLLFGYYLICKHCLQPENMRFAASYFSCSHLLFFL